MLIEVPPTAQELLLQQGVLGHVIPLLLGFDTTHEEGNHGGQPAFDLAESSQARGPAFLGLGIERTNMQVASLLLSLLRSQPGGHTYSKLPS